MAQYILRRLLLIPPTFIGITLIVFTITRFVPGGPVERMIAEMQQNSLQEGGGSTSEMQGGSLSDEQMAQLNEYYGFDKPIIISYGLWLGKVLTGDLGHSSRYGDPVIDTISERLPISIFYGITSMLITYLVCIPLGIVKAIKHDTVIDNATSAAVFVGYALPSYVVAIILMVYFGSELEWFPLGGFMSDDFEDFTLYEQVIDIIYHAVLPLSLIHI